MPQYRIANRITHAVVDVEAPTAADACERCGWLIGNCYVQPRPEDLDVDPDMAALLADISERMIRLPEPRRARFMELVNRALDLVEGPDQDADGDPDAEGNDAPGVAIAT
jgi:hypothetical protein